MPVVRFLQVLLEVEMEIRLRMLGFQVIEATQAKKSREKWVNPITCPSKLRKNLIPISTNLTSLQAG